MSHKFQEAWTLALHRTDALIEEELAILQKRTESFATKCLEQGKPLAQGDRLSIYTDPLRSWCHSIYGKMRITLPVDAITKTHESGSQEMTDALGRLSTNRELLLTRKSLLEQRNQGETKARKGHTETFLLLAHIVTAMTESLTVTSAFQLFGGTVLVQIPLFIALFAFFYYLPFGIHALLGAMQERRMKRIAMFFVIAVMTAVFFFLGTLRASYGSALGDGKLQVPLLAFIIFNWMFLALGYYLSIKRMELSLKQREHDAEDIARLERESLREALKANEREFKELETNLHELNRLTDTCLSKAHAVRERINAAYLEMVELFKLIVITHQNGAAPDCFTDTIPPLDLPEQRNSRLPIIQ